MANAKSTERTHMPQVLRGDGTVVVTVSNRPKRRRGFLSCRIQYVDLGPMSVSLRRLRRRRRYDASGRTRPPAVSRMVNATLSCSDAARTRGMYSCPR